MYDDGEPKSPPLPPALHERLEQLMAEARAEAGGDVAAARERFRQRLHTEPGIREALLYSAARALAASILTTDDPEHLPA